MQILAKRWKCKLKVKVVYVKTILFLILSIALSFFIIFIGITHPYISYNGDKNIPKEDIVHFRGLTFRDLRMDNIIEYKGNSLIVKYFIVKKSLLPTKTILKLYCTEQYSIYKTYDIASFHFYETSGKMPFYWKPEEPFPDLEMCADNMLGVFWTTEKGIEFCSEY